jgi:hypothetical protein
MRANLINKYAKHGRLQPLHPNRPQGLYLRAECEPGTPALGNAATA